MSTILCGCTIEWEMGKMMNFRVKTFGFALKILDCAAALTMAFLGADPEGENVSMKSSIFRMKFMSDF